VTTRDTFPSGRCDEFQASRTVRAGIERGVVRRTGLASLTLDPVPVAARPL